jgi:hypothetical protein
VKIPSEQAYCPACDLKHTRQPDWLCPQCGMPVETEAWRSTVRGRSEESEERAPEFPLGSVVGGAILVATSLVLALGFARSPVVAGRWPLVAATVLLAVLGFELLFKVSAARWVAIAIAVIALILVSEDLLRARLPDLMGDPLPAGIRAALQGSIRALYPLRILFASGLLVGTLLLVAGRPGRWRIAAGALIAATLPVAELVRWLMS